MQRAACIALLGGLPALAASQASTPQGASLPLPSDIAGAWRSEAPEFYGNHFATRAFNITDRAWQVTYRAFADADGTQPLFTIRVRGHYVLGGASDSVAGAVEGIFPAVARGVTAESDAGARMFAAMSCPLRPGQEKALLNSG
jgi:hypothetical protein